MAVTAPVCPRKTDIGKPSGKRHYENQIVNIMYPKKTWGEGINKNKNKKLARSNESLQLE